MSCEPWEEIMSEMVLFDRWEITPKSKARALAAEIRKSFEEGMKDLEELLRKRDLEYDELRERMQKYEPDWVPRKFS